MLNDYVRDSRSESKKFQAQTLLFSTLCLFFARLNARAYIFQVHCDSEAWVVSLMKEKTTKTISGSIFLLIKFFKKEGDQICFGSSRKRIYGTKNECQNANKMISEPIKSSLMANRSTMRVKNLTNECLNIETSKAWIYIVLISAYGGLIIESEEKNSNSNWLWRHPMIIASRLFDFPIFILQTNCQGNYKLQITVAISFLIAENKCFWWVFNK